MVNDLPGGTVTFLFTDIEGSTGLAQRFGAGYVALIGRHFAIIRTELDRAGGVEVKKTGDGVFAVFSSAPAAVEAASSIQRAMTAHKWPDGGEVKVRIGIHSGQAQVIDDDYLGIDVHRASRVMSAGHGGQIVVTEATRLLAGGTFEFKSLGRHLLRGLEAEESVYQLVVANLPSEFPPLSTAAAIPNNLPVRLSSIIGRGPDIETLTSMIEAHRLVTLLGPGGVGKTSLAVTVGSRVIDRFPGGVTFVDLSSLTDPTFVVASVASELHAEPRTVEGVVARLSGVPALVILDNFEQVIAAASDIGRLVAGGVDARFLITSQVPLRLPGEHRHVLGPLEVNGSPEPAGIRLFIDRALAVDPSFQPDPVAVGELVRRLDGLPLAIELVAARANVMSPTEMLDRLGSGKLSYTAHSGSLERHRSLDAALQWSYDLLDAATQSVFRRLGVFEGDMSLAAAEEIARADQVSDPMESIAELVDRSLLLRQTGSSSRYRMLDGVRRLARGLLDTTGEAESVRERFIGFYIRLAGNAFIGLQSDQGEWWKSQLDDELDNLREVLTILHTHGRAVEGLELLGNIWRFYHSRGRLLEYDVWLRRFFEIADEVENCEGLIKGLMARAAVSYWREDADAAVVDYSDALERARRLGDRPLVAEALYGLATSLTIAGRQEESAPLLEEVKHLYAELGDEGGLADVVAGEGFVAINDRGLAGLGPLFEEATELYERAGRTSQATQSVLAQTAVALAEGRFDDARALARRGISRGVEMADVFLQVWGLEYLASAELGLGHIETAGLIVGGAEASRERIGGGWRPGIVGLENARSALETRMGIERAEELIAPGRDTSLLEVVALALGKAPEQIVYGTPA